MPQLLTVGHGTLDQASFVSLVAGAGITDLVDVRRFPGSRRHPHFATDAMQRWLPQAGIGYRWESRLGGRRRLEEADRDTDPWWTVEAFRAYAAHTRTQQFAEGLGQVLAACSGPGSGPGETAVMCSESLWWRCHRRLIADVAVLLHDVPVLHLAHSGRLTAHVPAAGARTTPDGLRYDGPRDDPAAGSVAHHAAEPEV